MNKDITLKEIEYLVDFAKSVINFINLNPDEIKSLFSYLCVKDEEGKWNILNYGNYKVIFNYDRIWIKLNNPLYTEKGEIIPFKDIYVVKAPFPSEQEKVSEYIKFPEYTGYNRIFNGELKDIMKK